MVELSHEFVAGKLWLLVAIVTLPLTALAAVLGYALALPEVILAPLVAGVPIVGWFLIVPVLMFFGEEVADALVGPPRSSDAAAGNPGTVGDPVESLKRRYASGEIDEREFERRLERLLALDEVGASETAVDVLLAGDGEPESGDRPSGRMLDEQQVERE